MFKLDTKIREIIVAISGDMQPEQTFLGSYIVSWDRLLKRFQEDAHRRGFVGGYKAGEKDEKEKFETSNAYQQGYTCGYDDGARESENDERYNEGLALGVTIGKADVMNKVQRTLEKIEGMEWEWENIPQTFDDIPTD